MKFFALLFSTLLLLLPLATPLALGPRNADAAQAETKLSICIAARLNTMEEKARVDGIKVSTDFAGFNWQGVDLPDGRHYWAAKHRWGSSESCWGECFGRCLKPALGWGFDAAVCRIRRKAALGHYSCMWGYTPDPLHACKRDNEKLCDDGFIYDNEDMRRTNMKYALRDFNGTSAHEVWDGDGSGTGNFWIKYGTEEYIPMDCSEMEDPACPA